MKTNLLKLNKAILKVSSLIFGYFFWLIIAQNQQINITKKIPLYFFGLKKELKASSNHEQINVLISGKRIELSNFSPIENSAHIDLSDITCIGTYTVKVPKENIFLHNNFKLVNYWPSNLSIQIV